MFVNISYKLHLILSNNISFENDFGTNFFLNLMRLETISRSEI